MTAPHDPQVMPFVGITDGFVVTCDAPGCDLNEAFMAEADAQERADRHREETGTDGAGPDQHGGT